MPLRYRTTLLGLGLGLLTIARTTGGTGTSNSSYCNISCPGQLDPKNYTDCCLENKNQLLPKCCPERNPVAFHVDDRVVQIVGMTVISSCIVLALLLLVCCFCSGCPLYNTCRGDYTQAGQVAYGAKEDDPLTSGDMPLMDVSGPHQYNVTIKPVEEV